ncbi:MAG: bestrophin family ion channel [Phycisphaerales bacterium]|nr:bestrophin family ion channel [Phycisphaerales bacterium]
MILKEKKPIIYLLGLIKREFILTVILCLFIDTLLFYNQNILQKLIATSLSIPTTVLGTCISLLLAFLLGYSYLRWWDARIFWGEIVGESRNIARNFLSITTSNSSVNPFIIRNFINRQICWVFIVAQQLRQQNNTQETLNKYLINVEVNRLKDCNNIANMILLLQSENTQQLLKANVFSEQQATYIQKCLSDLSNAMGKAERIKNTHFPNLYGLLVSWFTVLFMIILQMNLHLNNKDIPYLFDGIITVVIGNCFFLIHKVAKLLQDPFENQPTDTPITSIACNIENDLKELLGDNLNQNVDDNNHKRFYLM